MNIARSLFHAASTRCGLVVVAFALLLSGCASSPAADRKLAETKATAVRLRQRASDPDLTLQMQKRFADRFKVATADYERAIAAGQTIVGPKILAHQQPIYPLGKRATWDQCLVWVAFVVDREGRVADVEALSDDDSRVDPKFAAAAMNSVRTWKLSPATANNIPIAMVLVVPMAFTLEP